ncbi:MAG TPA: peptidoglycan-binding protein, partial [Rubrivivax sp.]|nr:peptidoglycan-binding protein [Rubrivivax sp.]
MERSKQTSRARNATLGCALLLALAGAGPAHAQEMGGGSKGAVTGAAGGATAEGANSALERCDQALGTIGVVEDQSAPWYHTLQSYKLGSTVPVLRMMIQQS